MVRVRSYSLSKVTVALATLFHSETIDVSDESLIVVGLGWQCIGPMVDC